MKHIFISHWAAEASVALELKEWIENIFDNTHVFVSSSDSDIILGDKWEETMVSELKRADVAIILVSKNSYNRKWIHIETGFCLARELKLMIVRIDDLTPEEMGRPYDSYQSFPIGAPNFSKLLLTSLAEVLDSELSDQIGYECMQMEINEKAKETL